MELGQRIRSARVEAGLSQRQLCGETITRNMLSQIENGQALPSLPTLEMLSQRLGKPMGYFFGEDPVRAGHRSAVDQAWLAYRSGEPAEAARILDSQKETFQDVAILRTLVLLQLAEQSISQQRYPYALEILGWAQEEAADIPELSRRAVLMKGRIPGQKAEPLLKELPPMDEELLLRARAALEQQNPKRAASLLEAAEDQKNPEWAFLRGRVFFDQREYPRAARCFHQAEKSRPRETARYLEQCYREMEDFKQAYFYACQQK